MTKRTQRQIGAVAAMVAGMLILLGLIAGCATIPPDAVRITPELQLEIKSAVDANLQAVGQVGVNQSAGGYINDEWTTRILALSSPAVMLVLYMVSSRFPVLRKLKDAIKGTGGSI